MQKVSEIFDIWPTVSDLSRDIGVPYPTLAAWKQRGSIPAAYWRDIVKSAHRRGHSELTADVLMDLHARPSAEARSGFAEDAEPFERQPQTTAAQKPDAAGKDTGHFTRFKHLRRSNFASAEEIEDHIRALRDEWSHR